MSKIAEACIQRYRTSKHLKEFAEKVDRVCYVMSVVWSPASKYRPESKQNLSPNPNSHQRPNSNPHKRPRTSPNAMPNSSKEYVKHCGWMLHGLYLNAINRDTKDRYRENVEVLFPLGRKMHYIEDQPDLDTVMPSHKAGRTGRKFREYKFSRHGKAIIAMQESCPEMFPVKIKDSKDYINRAVDLFRHYNLNRFLSCQVAHAHDYQHQNENVNEKLLLEYKAEIKEELQHSPLIKYTGKYLTEVQFFMDLEFKLFDTPTRQTDVPLILAPCAENCLEIASDTGSETKIDSEAKMDSETGTSNQPDTDEGWTKVGKKGSRGTVSKK